MLNYGFNFILGSIVGEETDLNIESEEASELFNAQESLSSVSVESLFSSAQEIT